jgi:hypothetical protein
MKQALLVVLVILIILMAGCTQDEANEVVTNAAAKSIRFLIFDTDSNAVKPEPIATASAVEDKTQCLYMGLVVECK